ETFILVEANARHVTYTGMRKSWLLFLLAGAVGCGGSMRLGGGHHDGGNPGYDGGGNQAGCGSQQGCYTVYAHSNTILYRIDLMAKTLVEVGPFKAPN